jgi:hypothetical protein
MATLTERRTLACMMDFLVAHKARIAWQEVRPITRLHTPEELERLVLSFGGWRTDCSGSATTLFQAAGLQDPNGRGYDGEGNTQIMYDHLPRYSDPKGAGIGALCFFGLPGNLPSQHITIVRHPGADPVLFTLGGKGDPSYRLLSWMRSGFQGHPVFLNVSHL